LGHCESVGCNEQRHGQKGKKKGSLDLITCAIKNRGRQRERKSKSETQREGKIYEYKYSLFTLEFYLKVMLKKQTQLDFFFVKNLVNNLEHIGLEKHL